MDEITFEDMLVHYEGKLQEAADELQNLRHSLKDVLAILESSWSGRAADACRRKLEEVGSHTAKSANALSDAQLQLSKIGELLFADEINVGLNPLGFK